MAIDLPNHSSILKQQRRHRAEGFYFFFFKYHENPEASIRERNRKLNLPQYFPLLSSLKNKTMG